jgi:hypothetical protein
MPRVLERGTTGGRVRLSAAAMAVLTAVALAAAGCGDAQRSPDAEVRDGLDALKDVPHAGYSLGSSTAPWTFEVFAAPTNYQLSRFVADDLAGVVAAQVKSGRLKILMRTVGTVPAAGTDDARKAAQLLQAAGVQDRFWPTLVAFSSTYGGVWEEDRVPSILRAGGADIARAQRDRSDKHVLQAVEKANRLAGLEGARGRPLYLLRKSDGTRLDLSAAVRDGRIADELRARVAGASAS